MFRRLLATAVVAALATLGVAAAASSVPMYPAPSPAPGGVSAGTVTVGGVVTFSGRGFAAGSNVAITASGGDATIDGEAVLSAGVTRAADDEGTFSVRVRLLDVATYTLQATGSDADGNPVVLSARVRSVSSDAAASTQARGEPSLAITGASGTSMQVWMGVGLLALGTGLVALTLRRRRAGSGSAV